MTPWTVTQMPWLHALNVAMGVATLGPLLAVILAAVHDLSKGSGTR
jgi:hypothetical protein